MWANHLGKSRENTFSIGEEKAERIPTNDSGRKCQLQKPRFTSKGLDESAATSKWARCEIEAKSPRLWSELHVNMERNRREIELSSKRASSPQRLLSIFLQLAYVAPCVLGSLSRTCMSWVSSVASVPRPLIAAHARLVGFEGCCVARGSTRVPNKNN